MTAKRRSPSDDRYQATHPAKTVHFDQETFDRIGVLLERSGLTASQFIRQALGSMERHIDVIQPRGKERYLEEGRLSAIMDGYDLGHADAVRRFSVTYACQVCKKAITLEPGAEDTEAATTFLTQCGWHCAECDVS
jgi:hypothetical protein